MLMLILHHQTNSTATARPCTGNADADGSEAVGIAGRQTAVAEQKAMTDAQIAAARLQLDGEKAQSQFALQSDQQDLKEDQHAHKVKIDEVSWKS